MRSGLAVRVSPTYLPVPQDKTPWESSPITVFRSWKFKKNESRSDIKVAQNTQYYVTCAYTYIYIYIDIDLYTHMHINAHTYMHTYT